MPTRRPGPPIEMDEGFGEADTGKTKPLSRSQKGKPVMPRQRHIDRDRPVLRLRSAANSRIPALAPMP